MTGFDLRMEALKARFRTRVKADADALSDALGRNERQEICQLAHRLSGNAGMFGYPDIGVAAERLERAIDDCVAEEQLHKLASRLLTEMRAIQED